MAAAEPSRSCAMTATALAAYCRMQEPGPGGADLAVGLYTGAAAMPRRVSRQRKSDRRCTTPGALLLVTTL